MFLARCSFTSRATDPILSPHLLMPGKNIPTRGQRIPVLIELVVRRWNIAMRESLQFSGDPSLRGLCGFLGYEFNEKMPYDQSEIFRMLIRGKNGAVARNPTATLPCAPAPLPPC